MIIGVSGPMGAGKSTVCGILEKKGFRYISLSDILREECRKRGLSIVRENLRKVGDELRKKYGKAALAILAWKKIESEPGDWVIDSVRVPEEARFIQSKGGFMIGVVAPAELRYRRLMERKREGEEKISFEEFLEMDKRDRELGIDQVVSEADFVIENDSSLEELEKGVEEIIKAISLSSRSS